MIASHEEYPEIVELLLEKGADVNSKNNNGASILYIGRNKI